MFRQSTIGIKTWCLGEWRINFVGLGTKVYANQPFWCVNFFCRHLALLTPLHSPYNCNYPVLFFLQWRAQKTWLGTVQCFRGSWKCNWPVFFFYSGGRKRPDWELSSDSGDHETDNEKDFDSRKASKHAMEMPPKNKKYVFKFTSFQLYTRWGIKLHKISFYCSIVNELRHAKFEVRKTWLNFFR